jgi:hypothetical protein
MNMLRRNIWISGLVLGTASFCAALAVTAPPGQAAPRVEVSQVTASIDTELAITRAATRRYLVNPSLAKADGYGVMLGETPTGGLGVASGFDVRRPPVLIYAHRGRGWQLTGVEWAFDSRPAQPPLPGARYATVRSGCRYADGAFVPEPTQAACPKASPRTGAAVASWRQKLVTLHVWLWYPNPRGIFASTDPFATYESPLLAAYAGRG